MVEFVPVPIGYRFSGYKTPQIPKYKTHSMYTLSGNTFVTLLSDLGRSTTNSAYILYAALLFITS